MMSLPADRCDLMRWTASAVAALCAHMAIAGVVAGWSTPILSGETAGAIVIELAPIHAAPEASPEETAPGPPQVEAAASAASPGQMAEEPSQDKDHPFEQDRSLERAPTDEAIAEIPTPKARANPSPSTPQQPSAPSPATTAPMPAPHVAALATAPAIGRATPRPATILTWKGRLVGHLERRKRYPPEARARREQGVAHLSFSIDRAGRLVESRIARSSGSAALDREALALAQRAQPFPPPPRELPGDPIKLLVPVRFNVR